jgi:hypothetical protein
VVEKVRWNPAKAESNWQKHGVRFVEAETIFNHQHVAWLEDEDHSEYEDRYLAIGESVSRSVDVCWSWRTPFAMTRRG